MTDSRDLAMKELRTMSYKISDSLVDLDWLEKYMKEWLHTSPPVCAELRAHLISAQDLIGKATTIIEENYCNGT